MPVCLILLFPRNRDVNLTLWCEGMRIRSRGRSLCASGGTADALASGASVRKGVGVQIPPRAQIENHPGHLAGVIFLCAAARRPGPESALLPCAVHTGDELYRRVRTGRVLLAAGFPGSFLLDALVFGADRREAGALGNQPCGRGGQQFADLRGGQRIRDAAAGEAAN